MGNTDGLYMHEFMHDIKTYHNKLQSDTVYCLSDGFHFLMDKKTLKIIFTVYSQSSILRFIQ